MALRTLVLITGAIGASFLLGGGWLADLGSSGSYVVAGLGYLASAAYLWTAKPAGLGA